MVFEIAAILALILANGLFAGAEISVIALRKSRVRQLIEEGRPAARAVEALRKEPERFLATVQIGITVIGATAAVFSGASIAKRLTPLLGRIQPIAHVADDLSLALVVAGISYLTLVFGELVPKSIALRWSEVYALLVGRPILWLSWFTRPLVRLLTASSNLVLKPLGDATSFSESRMSADELQALVDEAAESGSVDAGAGELASRALEFGTLTAAEVMVPRNLVAAIPRSASSDEVRRLLLEHGHARMPVIGENLDDVVGYVTALDVLSLGWQRELLVLDDVLRPPLFVPEAKRAVDLLQELRAKRLWLAVVVDEHGGVAGIVTLEDLVEELVGELVTEREAPDQPIQLQADGSALAQGAVPLRDLNRELDLDLPEGETWSTLAGLCIVLAGRIPTPGTILEAKEARLEVVEATPRAVKLVRVRRVTPPPPQA